MIKRIITIVICLLLVGTTYYKFDEIVYFTSLFLDSTPKVEAIEKNKYYKEENFDYVQNTDDFTPYSFQELLNVFYTAINAGYEVFTFYCPNEYLDCIEDVKKISSEDNIDILTTIGNYVSPFNNFNSIKIAYDEAGEVTIMVNHIYTQDEIKKINDKIDELWKNVVKEDMETEDIIYAFHDYIINNTKYDVNYEEELKTGITTYQSNKANGPLFQGYAICSGYTDIMSLILNRLGIKNYKVASETHVWNALYINDSWVHLDLTWDDPVSKNRDQDTLLHKFYLINTQTLEDFKIDNHEFNKSIYTELK